MAEDKQDISVRIVNLRNDVGKAQRLRAEAEAQLNVVKQKLEETDAALVKLGLKPETAEQELADLETQLDQLVTQLQESVSKEIAEYNTIVTQAKAALAQSAATA